MVRSPQYITTTSSSASDDNLKCLLLYQSITSSDLDFLFDLAVWSSALHLFHVASVAWSVKGTFLFNIRPSTGQPVCQEELYFAANQFWSRLIFPISCQICFFSQAVGYLGSFVLLTSESHKFWVLESRQVVPRDSRMVYSPWLQCRVHFLHPVSSCLVQGLLHEQSIV